MSEELQSKSAAELMAELRGILSLDLKKPEPLQLLVDFRQQIQKICESEIYDDQLDLAGDYAAQHVELTLSDEFYTLNVAQKMALAEAYLGYRRLPDDIKSRAEWQDIEARLLENNAEKLKLAMVMQGGGQFFGIDEVGRGLFKDRGAEPVMYGYNKNDQLLRIYDRNPKEVESIQQWADYYKVRKQTDKEGYELFPCAGDEFTEEMEQLRSQIDLPVVNPHYTEWRYSWLDSGDEPPVASFARLIPFGGSVGSHQDPNYNSCNIGAMRLLRV